MTVLAAAAVVLLVLGCASASPLVGHDVSMVGAPVSARDAGPALQRRDAEPSAELYAKFQTAQVGDHFIEGETIFIFRGMTEQKGGDLEDRACCGCAPTDFTAVQVPSGQSGTWYGSWEPASSCLYTNGGGCLGYASVQRTWWGDSGFDSSTAQAVVNYINANSDLSQGYSWQLQNTATTSMSCCSTNSVSQIWSQSLWGWSNSQEQSCTGNACTGTSCGAWSAYQHANWALGVEGSTIFWGCSTGSNNVQC